jgi:hypothetical protein
MILPKILRTDEAQFTRAGIVNFHNIHIWDNQNPNAIRPKNFQREFSVNVWAGVFRNRLIGPYLLPPRLTPKAFRNFLDHHFLNILDDIRLHLIAENWMQLDVAPPHFGLDPRDWLEQHYRHRWIGRGGPVAWTPRSLNLTPCNFYLWGYLKDIVYSTPVGTW